MEILLTLLAIALIITLIVVVNSNPNSDKDKKKSSVQNQQDSGAYSEEGQKPPEENDEDDSAVKEFSRAIALLLVLAGLGLVVGLMFFPAEWAHLRRPSVGVFVLCVGFGLFLTIWHRRDNATPHSLLIGLVSVWVALVVTELISHEHLSDKTLSKQWCDWLVGLGIGFCLVLPFVLAYQTRKWRLLEKLEAKAQVGIQVGGYILGLVYLTWSVGCTIFFFEQVVKP